MRWSCSEMKPPCSHHMQSEFDGGLRLFAHRENIGAFDGLDVTGSKPTLKHRLSRRQSNGRRSSRSRPTRAKFPSFSLPVREVATLPIAIVSNVFFKNASGSASGVAFRLVHRPHRQFLCAAACWNQTDSDFDQVRYKFRPPREFYCRASKSHSRRRASNRKAR